MMKNIFSYLFLSSLICIYVATNIGVKVHFCSMEGTSKIVLFAGELLCNCTHHSARAADSGHKECCCKPVEQEEPIDQCCLTTIYMLDKAQSVSGQKTVDVKRAVLDITTQTPLNNTLPNAIALTFRATDVKRDPGGGLFAFAPLRL